MISMVTLESLSTNLLLTLLMEIANEGLYVRWSVSIPTFRLHRPFAFCSCSLLSDLIALRFVNVISEWKYRVGCIWGQLRSVSLRIVVFSWKFQFLTGKIYMMEAARVCTVKLQTSFSWAVLFKWFFFSFVHGGWFSAHIGDWKRSKTVVVEDGTYDRYSDNCIW